ncbi:MAG: prolyl oligopeptidase family serine peptidase [Candidatus Krumholzibacteria bacterium]|nr:prolyl oligopeptidase family serine peptidase [Candidatus Krumholzibacteria bacterium]
MKPSRETVRERPRRHARPIAILLPIVFFASIYGLGEAYRREDFRDSLRARHGCLLPPRAVLDKRDASHEYRTVALMNEGEVSVTASLKTPIERNRRYPALVILGGLRTGHRTVDYLGQTSGLVLLCIDYPYTGKREGLTAWEFLRAVPAIRLAILETVPAVMLGVDYLLSRDDVDPDRIVIAGGSLGALFAPAAVACDDRIAAAALLLGAGDIERLARANINAPALLAAPAAWAVAVLTAPVEPLDYVGRISPRPVFMLSATGDPRIPLECSRLLHETAREPKTIRWIGAGHVSVRDREFHALIGRELLDWLAAEELIAEDR